MEKMGVYPGGPINDEQDGMTQKPRAGKKRAEESLDRVGRYTAFLGRHPRGVIVFWMVVLAASAYNATQLLNDTVFAFKPPKGSYGVCLVP